jgi:hypothetical protein
MSEQVPAILANESRYFVPREALFSAESGLKPEWRQMIGLWLLQVRIQRFPPLTILISN